LLLGFLTFNCRNLTKGELAHCYRCGYTWTPRRTRVRICARCKSPHFWYPKVRVPSYGGGLGVAEIIGSKREEVLRLSRRYGAKNVRIFGSVARRQATETSDIDVLIEPMSSRKYASVDLALALGRLLGRRVDLVPESSLHWLVQPRVLLEAVPL
jgi:predicted nucleotidyltransferase